jgi:hypothetical protein
MVSIFENNVDKKLLSQLFGKRLRFRWYHYCENVQKTEEANF